MEDYALHIEPKRPPEGCEHVWSTYTNNWIIPPNPKQPSQAHSPFRYCERCDTVESLLPSN